jgi:hypothetical protein
MTASSDLAIATEDQGGFMRLEKLVKVAIMAGLLLWTGNATAQSMEIRLRHVLDILSNRTEEPAEVWVMFPNGSDSNDLKTELDTVNVPNPHRAMLAFHPDDLVGNLPHGAMDVDQCFFLNGYKYLPLVYMELTIGSNLPGPVHVDRAAMAPSSSKSLEWLANLDQLTAFWDTSARRLRTDLFKDDYGTGIYPPVVARALLTSGSMETAKFFTDAAAFYADPGETVPLSPRRKLAREVVVRYGKDRPSIKITDFKKNQLYDLSFRPKREVKVYLMNTAGCDKGDSTQFDFLLHFLLRSGRKTHYLPRPVVLKATGGPNDNPQCSPGDNKWP